MKENFQTIHCQSFVSIKNQLINMDLLSRQQKVLIATKLDAMAQNMYIEQISEIDSYSKSDSLTDV